MTIKLYLSIVFTAIILFSCSNSKNQELKESEPPEEQVTLVDEENFKGVLFHKNKTLQYKDTVILVRNYIFPDSSFSGWTPTVEEIFKAEKIIGETNFVEEKYTEPDISLKFYFRQYMGLAKSDNKYIWINFLAPFSADDKDNAHLKYPLIVSSLRKNNFQLIYNIEQDSIRSR